MDDLELQDEQPDYHWIEDQSRVKATAAKANGANTNIDSDSGERDGIFVERQGFPWI